MLKVDGDADSSYFLWFAFNPCILYVFSKLLLLHEFFARSLMMWFNCCNVTLACYISIFAIYTKICPKMNVSVPLCNYENFTNCTCKRIQRSTVSKVLIIARRYRINGSINLSFTDTCISLSNI